MSAKILALFSRDEEAFWRNHFTDAEKKLARMDVWELAGVIEEAAVRPGMDKQRIVAEHLLGVWLAQVQAKASWGSGILGFIGALVGAALSVTLTNMWHEPSRLESTQPTVRAAPEPAVRANAAAVHSAGQNPSSASAPRDSSIPQKK